MGKIKNLFTSPWKIMTAPLKDGTATAGQVKSRLGATIKELRSNRNPTADNAPDLADFNAVLAHWEIEPHQIPNVIRGLKTRMILFCLLGVYGLYLTLTAYFKTRLLFFIAGPGLVALGATAVLTSAWRIQVLQQKRFVLFKQWLGELVGGKR